MKATNSMTAADLLAELQQLANPANVAGMARFGIRGKHVLGISMVQLRPLAKRVGKNHALVEDLWASGIYEARLLTAFLADPARLTRQQADAWAKEFECWADCDGLCIHLLRKTSFAHELAVDWSQRPEELVKRAGFTMMATLAVHDKKCSESVFNGYLQRIEMASDDGRNDVKKAVNWALRQIGKRNYHLNTLAIQKAKAILLRGTSSARWIARDALRELRAKREKLLLKETATKSPA